VYEVLAISQVDAVAKLPNANHGHFREQNVWPRGAKALLHSLPQETAEEYMTTEELENLLSIYRWAVIRSLDHLKAFGPPKSVAEIEKIFTDNKLDVPK
jgi:hypothetical protein